MRKQDKKRDNAIRQALTRVCDILLDSQPGFRWLTHTVNYQRFPQSLSIILVFENDEDMLACRTHEHARVSELVSTHLQQEGISLSRADRHLHFDSEAACDAQHNGNWAKRLSSH